METLSLAQVGVEPSAVGLSAAWSTVANFTARPAKAAGTKIVDDGTAAAKLEEFLVSQKFI